ncbi:MAG TPA: gliding motility-associated ABC transporter permease subunit GldF [Salinivirgaceae bacterium]|nr:gliding motility-associated ABC transporter permease subunit GldF [Salinivirgaceae bacterium]
MIELYKKEVSGFFSSLTGYIVVVIFLLTTGLFLWVLPGDLNLPDNGYAHLAPLFAIAPWIFLFLTPAVTMKLFSEEKKSGTIHLLWTKPITDLQIVLAKYFAGLSIVLISLLPTLIYYYSVSRLASPVGNVDHGATIGSYLGLFFLAAIYVAIGTFASSLTKNQIISFLIALTLSFFLYTGFDSLGTLTGSYEIGYFLRQIGINEHYRSISRGVIDSRDLIYFISMVALFIAATRTKLQSRKW